uniref:Uncharacterized protein n=1 Tax=Acrobeloides nanus TaxID=290746 RepID=A0A914CGU5_9BILA
MNWFFNRFFGRRQEEPIPQEEPSPARTPPPEREMTEFERWVKLDPSLPADAEPRYGKTEIEQECAFVILPSGSVDSVQYTIRLYMDENHKNLCPDGYQRWIACCRDKDCVFPTREKAEAHISRRLRSLKKELQNEQIRTAIRVVPKGRHLEFLKLSDHIRVKLHGFSAKFGYHEGIYVGNERVIHVSGHDSNSIEAYISKKESCARLGHLVPHFIFKDDDEIEILVYRIQFRTIEHIIFSAIDYAITEYGKGEYHFFCQNCQHFGCLCSTNKTRMEDKKIFLSTSTFVDNVVRRIFGETVQNKTTSKLRKWLYELFETGEGGETRRIIGKMAEIEKLLDLLEEKDPEKRQELIETMIEIRERENHADEERDRVN